MHPPIRTRPARADDAPFILGLAPRLADFELPPWRTREEVVEGTRRWLEKWLDQPRDAASPSAALLLAESDDGERLGFVLIHERDDFFTGARHAHVSDLAVATDAAGKGAGTTLMHAAEIWARDHGHSRLTLNVFATNTRARALYEHLGYELETLAYVKRVD